MAGGTAKAVSEPLETLFGAGTCAGMSDGQLLSRFLAGRDQTGELAFQALVLRHGPMVWRVCDQALDDPNDVHDALQAVFLVLARRAGSIRSRHSVGSWLYGVALRVASRVRVTAIRRRIRDRRTNLSAQTIAVRSPRQGEQSLIEREEQARIVHQEVGRLPEKYRAPITLCYLEGLTHDEAATRLRWPVGTVRSRLSRARETLRRRLNRRGVGVAGLVGPLGVWLSTEQVASAASAGALAASSPGCFSTSLASTVAKMVCQVPGGQPAAASTVHASSLAIAQGVLNMMVLKKWIVMASALVALSALTVTSGVVWVRTSHAQFFQEGKAQPPANQLFKSKPVAQSDESPDDDRLLADMLEVARLHYASVGRLFKAGEIAFDRLVDAGEQLDKVELMNAKSDEARIMVRKRTVTRLKDLEAQVKATLAAGQVSRHEMGVVTLRRMQAELDLRNSAHDASDLTSILRRLRELERKVDQLENQRVKATATKK
jgi:RNA polymerase sigma factor (sigma-70 family)